MGETKISKFVSRTFSTFSEKVEEVHSEETPEFMKILNDDSEEFVYVEIDNIDQGQFSIINHLSRSRSRLNYALYRTHSQRKFVNINE